MMSARADRIDDAVSSAGQLIAALQDVGPVNGAQANVIIGAAVRASIPNAQGWEVVASVKRVMKDLERHGGGYEEMES